MSDYPDHPADAALERATGICAGVVLVLLILGGLIGLALHLTTP